jgi:hypothetical protein
MSFITAVILAAIVAVGCSSPQQANDLSTVEQAAAEPTPENVVQSRAAQDSIRAAEVQEEHQQRVATYREAFAVEDTWHDQLESSPYPFVQACVMMTRADEMKFAVDVVKGGLVTWDELGLTEVQAKEKLRATARTAAQSLFKGWKQPRSIRTQGQPCHERGEGQYDWTEGIRLLQDIERVLDLGSLAPTDIGSSPAELRGLLIADLKLELEEARQKGSDAMGWFLMKFKDARDQYNVMPVEVGLKPEEISQIDAG